MKRNHIVATGSSAASLSPRHLHNFIGSASPPSRLSARAAVPSLLADSIFFMKLNMWRYFAWSKLTLWHGIFYAGVYKV